MVTACALAMVGGAVMPIDRRPVGPQSRNSVLSPSAAGDLLTESSPRPAFWKKHERREGKNYCTEKKYEVQVRVAFVARCGLCCTDFAGGVRVK